MDTSSLKSEFKAVLGAVLKADGLSKIDEICGFIPLVGKQYKRELMIIGKAVNGWRNQTDISKGMSESKIIDFVEDVYNDSILKEYNDPMQWLHDCWKKWIDTPINLRKYKDDIYNPKKSQFWMAIGRLLKEVYGWETLPELKDWPCHLVWSNLYKIAPAGGGNPNDSWQEPQRKACIEMLRAELNLFRPQRVLFLTGAYWADPFLEGLGAEDDGKGVEGNVQRHGLIKLDNVIDPKAKDAYITAGRSSSEYVVATHPQGKKRSDWVQQVLASFGS